MVSLCPGGCRLFQALAYAGFWLRSRRRLPFAYYVHSLHFHVYLLHFFVFLSHLVDMALIADVAPDMKDEMLAKASSDLLYMLDRREVDEGFTTKLISVGVTTVDVFAAFVKDEEDLEKVLKDNFGIDATTLQGRIKASKIKVAWLAAKTRAAKQLEDDGDNEIRRRPKDVPHTVLTSMHEAFEKTYWTIEEDRQPARSYVERKMEEIEKNDHKAESLEEVVSVKEDDPDAMRTEWKPDGQLRAIRVGTKVPLPKTSEELRRRIGLIGTAYIYAKFQQVHKAYLKDVTPQIFNEHVDYILGDHVLGLAAVQSDGTHTASPSWALVLSYEHAVRKRMVLYMKKGHSLKDALKMAREDPVTKERCFTTPLCVDSVSRKRPAPADVIPQVPQTPFAYTTKGKEKGKGKGKGKEKGKKVRNNGFVRENARAKARAAPNGCAFQNAEGAKVCFKFNDPKGCQNTACPFVHMCGRCFAANVPMHRCKRCGTA